jgi:RNA exonuclease 4
MPKAGEKRKREDNESDGKKNVKKAKTVTTIESVKKTTESSKKTKTVLNSNWDKIKDQIPKSKKKKAPKYVPSSEKYEVIKISEYEKEEKVQIEQYKQKIKRMPGPVNASTDVTKYLALDCEMVGVGINGQESALARVCIVNSYGNVIYDKFVRTNPKDPVVDYRTKWSGVRPGDLKGPNAHTFELVQKEVAAIIDGKIVVGHSLLNDFRALMLSHPWHLCRDTAKYRPLQRSKGKPHALRYLMKTILGIEIQSGEHEPDEDARAALLLYKHLKKAWEKDIAAKMKRKYNSRTAKKKKTTQKTTIANFSGLQRSEESASEASQSDSESS